MDTPPVQLGDGLGCVSQVCELHKPEPARLPPSHDHRAEEARREEELEAAKLAKLAEEEAKKAAGFSYFSWAQAGFTDGGDEDDIALRQLLSGAQESLAEKRDQERE